MGLVIFVVLAAVAVVLWSQYRPPSAAPGPLAAGRTPRASPSPFPTATPSPSATTPAIPAPSRLLSAVNATTAWRATTGECPTAAAMPQSTTDGGAKWSTTNASYTTHADAMQRLMATSAGSASAISLSTDYCKPRLVHSIPGGYNWAAGSSSPKGQWYIDPSEPNRIHTPAHTVASPCPTAIAIAPVDDTHAALLCSDQRLFRTSDGGTQWDSGLTVPGTTAVAQRGHGYVIAETSSPGCSGVEVATLTATTGPTNVGCASVKGTARPGAVAVSSGDGTLWLWAGSSVVRSSDDGATWR